MDGSQEPKVGAANRIGKVVSVSGAHAVVLVDPRGDDAAGAPPANLQVGVLAEIPRPANTVYGLVTGITTPFPSRDDSHDQLEIVELLLIGECMRATEGGLAPFERGVSSMPAINDAVRLADQAALQQVYSPAGALSVQIGTIQQDRRVPAHVMVDELLGKHFAILGTTGAGKSCAATLIMQAILDANTNAHMVLLDPHGEYSSAFGERANVLNPSNFQLPYWLFEFEELLEVLLGPGCDTNAPEASILAHLIPIAKGSVQASAAAPAPVSIDTPVPYRLSELQRLMDDAMGRLDKPETLRPYRLLQSRLKALQADPRFKFMFDGIAVRDNMASVLCQILRIPVAGQPITILDLSGVPSEIVNVVVAVICRLIFNFALWSERQVPTLVVCEEAHRYAPRVDDKRFELSKRALSRIAKEGRKYGVSLCVICQRPSKVASDLLSQCNTIFAMRLTSNEDQEYLKGVLSDSLGGLFSCLPSLRNAEAVAVGQGIPVPTRLAFDHVAEDQRPHSGTAIFTSAWQAGDRGGDFVTEVVRRWRHQTTPAG